MCFLQHSLQRQSLFSGLSSPQLRHLVTSELIVAVVDFSYQKRGVTSRARVIDALERTFHSFLCAWSEFMARGSDVAIGCVEYKSVPAAHDRGGSFAHFSWNRFSCVLAVSIGLIVMMVRDSAFFSFNGW